ncbi:MAG: histidine phosphotransferase family protein [Pseudomonadota bacterium]|uniref:histidine phosphotransferase family protein n=1 Tax=Fodinicurvata fenggangensis TaxID=1121830 RepID=UPI00068E40E6|nr:histidine phosphotransferase family protein [Fodinicurvata fenggangensis]
MMSSADFRLAELLSSRLCHDLVGPISAIGNGTELLQEMSPMDAEAVDLIASSAGQASSKLAFFRLAYGAAGERISTLEDIRPVIDNWLKEERLALQWPETGGDHLAGHKGKILMNVLGLARECLPRGGELQLSVLPEEASLVLDLQGHGASVELRDDTAQGLDKSISPDGLTPRNVHAYFTRQLVELQDGSLGLDANAKQSALEIRVTLPG